MNRRNFLGSVAKGAAIATVAPFAIVDVATARKNNWHGTYNQKLIRDNIWPKYDTWDTGSINENKEQYITRNWFTYVRFKENPEHVFCVRETVTIRGEDLEEESHWSWERFKHSANTQPKFEGMQKEFAIKL